MDKIDKYLNESSNKEIDKAIIDYLDGRRDQWIIACNHAMKSLKQSSDKKTISNYLAKERKIWDELVDKYDVRVSKGGY